MARLQHTLNLALFTYSWARIATLQHYTHAVAEAAFVFLFEGWKVGNFFETSVNCMRRKSCLKFHERERAKVTSPLVGS